MQIALKVMDNDQKRTLRFYIQIQVESLSFSNIKLISQLFI